MTLDQAIAAFRKEVEDYIPEVVHKYYFNDWAPYASTAEVLAAIPLEVRWQYMTVNVAGVEYWFLPDLTTLVNKGVSIAIAAGSVALDKLQNFDQNTFPFRKSEGAGPLEVATLEELKTLLGYITSSDFTTELNKKVDKALGYSLVADTEINKIHAKFSVDEAAAIQAIVDAIANLTLTENNYSNEDKAKVEALNPNPYSISLPAAGTVAGRIAGATLPAGWSLTAQDKDLLITHGLGRRVAHVTVFTVDGTEETLCVGSAGYTGLKSPSADTVLVMGLTNTAVPLTINIFLA